MTDMTEGHPTVDTEVWSDLFFRVIAETDEGPVSIRLTFQFDLMKISGVVDKESGISANEIAKQKLASSFFTFLTAFLGKCNRVRHVNEDVGCTSIFHCSDFHILAGDNGYMNGVFDGEVVTDKQKFIESFNVDADPIPMKKGTIFALNLGNNRFSNLFGIALKDIPYSINIPIYGRVAPDSMGDLDRVFNLIGTTLGTPKWPTILRNDE
ncbi:hypothetical protein PCE1_000857 [Barthelona sp. PCE]